MKLVIIFSLFFSQISEIELIKFFGLGNFTLSKTTTSTSPKILFDEASIKLSCYFSINTIDHSCSDSLKGNPNKQKKKNVDHPLASKSEIYGNKIFYSSKAKQMIEQEIDDFVHLISLKSTNKVHQSLARSVKMNGIQFFHVSDYKLKLEEYQKIVSDATSFYIECDEGKLIIVSNHKNGFINAISYILHKFGYRFFGYSENWEYIPSKISFTNNYKGVLSPTMKGMHYAGTGGFGEKCNGKPITLKNRALLYNKRNGWVETTAQVNHSFQHFYKENKEYIDANPQIMSDYYESDGTTKQSGHIRDLNIDHQLTMPLVKKWFKDKLIKDLSVKHLSVSPADGLSTSYCSMPETKPWINNQLEKYIWIANEVGKYLRTEVPEWNGLISYTAYGNGTGVSTPPTFQGKYHLENFFLIQLIPYAFQHDYTGPDKDVKMITDWKSRYPEFLYTIYDYWDITQWSHGLPNNNLYNYVKRKAPLWKDNLYSFSIESTYFHPVVAPHLWVFKEYMQGYSDKTIDELYDEYYNKAFGTGAEFIEEMYKKWSSSYNGESEIAFSVDLINKAYNSVVMANETQAQKRIIELMAYIHFQGKYYDVKNAENNKQHHLKSLEYERYAKKIQKLAILQTWTVWAYNYGKIKKWGYRKSPENYCHGYGKVGFEGLKKEIVSQFKKDLSNYPITYSKVPFKGSTKKMKALQSSKKENYPISTGGGNYEIVSDREGKVVIKFIPQPLDTADYSFRFSDKDNIFDKIYLPKNNKGYTQPLTYTFKAKENTVYHLSLNGNFYDFKFPHSLSWRFVSSQRKSGTKQNTWFIYIPKKANEIVWTCKEKWIEKKKMKWFYYDEQSRLNEIPYSLYEKIAHNTFKIPSKVEGLYDLRGETTKIQHIVWKVEGNTPWDILNFEKVISYKPFNYEE